MKIIVATPLYPPEIPEPAPYTKTLVKHLREKHKITVVTYNNIAEPVQNVTIIAVQKQNKLPIRLFKYTTSLYKASKNADVIYAQNAVASGLPALIVGKLLNIPVIIRLVGDEAWTRATQLKQTTCSWEDFLKKPNYNHKIMWIMYIQRFVLKRVQLIITPSKKAKSLIAEAYNIPIKKIVTNYNPLPKKLKLPFNTKRKSYQIFVQTTQTEKTSLSSIVNTIKKLSKEFPNINLKIAGIEEEYIKQPTKYITQLGQISNAEVWYHSKQSQTIIQCDYKRAIPDSLYIGTLSLTPIITYKNNITNEFFKNSNCAIFTEQKNDFEIAIRKIFTDKEFVSSVVKSAYINILEKSSWDTHIKNLEIFFNTVINKKS